MIKGRRSQFSPAASIVDSTKGTSHSAADSSQSEPEATGFSGRGVTHRARAVRSIKKTASLLKNTYRSPVTLLPLKTVYTPYKSRSIYREKESRKLEREREKSQRLTFSCNPPLSSPRHKNKRVKYKKKKERWGMEGRKQEQDGRLENGVGRVTANTRPQNRQASRRSISLSLSLSLASYVRWSTVVASIFVGAFSRGKPTCARYLDTGPSSLIYSPRIPSFHKPPRTCHLLSFSRLLYSFSFPHTPP